MKKVIFYIVIAAFCVNCKSSNQVIVKKRQAIKKGIKKPSFENSPVATDLDLTSMDENVSESKIENIVNYAKQFNGVKYRFGGATADGMDCSGLVFESFRAFNILLPRSSKDMARKGEKISISNSKEGDLLFFITANKRNDINHVGLIVSTKNGNIEFIHATTSAGVITSKLSENYWNSAFVEARRIL